MSTISCARCGCDDHPSNFGKGPDGKPYCMGCEREMTMSEGGLSQSSVSAEQFMAQAQSQAHTQGLSQRVRAQYLAGGGDEAARGQLGGLLSEIVSPDGNTHYCAACKRDHTKDGPFPGRTAHYLTPDQFVVERAHLEELRKNADRANAIADEATRLLDENKSLALEVTRLRRKLGE